MKINTSPSVALKPSISFEAPFHTPAIADINWFTASLLPSPTQTPYIATSDSLIAHPLKQRSALLQELSNTAARALQKVSTSTDPIDMLKSTRAISAFHLETLLSAKMISKTSQAIEKLTNLS
ncbi:EscI/YscI/HrpB family type III secretion system inner rod protein [Pseudomonas psychrophila]|uniref:Type III secretion basal body protein I, YscI, HrpB, PscI n=1 Tax=Pseudomonas psychrophila TaxID=122355 RepID=A0ABY0W653_9PSED|nr:EscI/YscI/HrpB family type III secretion system inner rod protein [Pseudomonas psychrophila]KAB0490494.1 EscI/YscI/HrpB family type III secretion system inner rod protein [Pseudomonas psychrophila]QIE34960.1 EscI/YscI/HrpB family type III secretion system inner rod protein [Pseudomonas psychrophila]WVI97065.1 EscI/YscI/HrpB family type III secretion system inner rod protein [Pseudomonas psychrophila]SDU74941.1 Type III secretion basal body protein I, YscI, HrpB, PscI [Pseudomonas psychrophil